MAYNPAVADYVCEQLAMGRSLLSISRDADRIAGMPSRAEMQKWEAEEPHRSNSTQARVTGCHKMAEECVEIADDGTNDWMMRENGPQLNSEHVQRSKLRIETRLRLLGKWLPKVFGDRTAHELTGANGTSLIPPDPFAGLSVDELRAAIAALPR